jgi:hypothetical protein
MNRRSSILSALTIAVQIMLVTCAWPQRTPGDRASQLQKEQTQKMSPSAPAQLELTAASTGGRSRLLPGEAARFDLIFRNLSTHEEQFNSLTGNDASPVFQLYDAEERLLGRYTPASARSIVGDHMKYDPVPPLLVYLRRGAQDGSTVNLWEYANPLPPGTYRLDVSHEPLQGAAPIHANPVKFEIVPAMVTQAAVNYGSSARSSLLLSWIAQASDRKTPPELLLRLSVNENPGAVLVGATPAATVQPGAELASSALPPFSRQGDQGWLAIASGGTVELLHHALAHLDWRSGPIPFQLKAPKLIAGFPDRERALFLATGRTASGGAVLAGLPLSPDPARNTLPLDTTPMLQPGPSEPLGVDPDAVIDVGPPPPNYVPPKPAPPPPPVRKPDLPAYHPWTIPLKAEPIRAAVAFDTAGPVSVLLVYDDHGKLQLSRIDVDESGKVVAPERILLTGNETTGLLALAVDQRRDQPIAFVIAAVDRTRHDRLVLIRLPLSGESTMHNFPAVPGWPAKTEQELSITLAATEAAMEVATDGTPWLALVDEMGRLFGGPLNGSPLQKLRDRDKCSLPFVAAVPNRVTPGCFTESGELYLAGGGSHIH